ncbi:MAG: dienelactone hydrolase family protein [Bifidobacteriaceae bacterium]|jgi:phospholipase/carboxylesterase|nr:dienelactone hydrolase family protein [Bifidobacteriaceae bacterium]MCI1979219.1 dienelactone hydrolase family protein [Bifidobacteriaceae bacterium]
MRSDSDESASNAAKLHITAAAWSARDGQMNPSRPIFLGLHGWGSDENDFAELLQVIAPYNDYASLRAPIALSDLYKNMTPGQTGFSWLTEMMPQGDQLDREAFAGALAINEWIEAHIPSDRDIVPIGFSQGGLMVTQLLRVNPERFRAAVVLSGFHAPGNLAETKPAEERLPSLEIPVFFGFGEDDEVVPRYELSATGAWLEENTYLKQKSYRRLGHGLFYQEVDDLRTWLLDMNITSGLM